ncbi:hypothetical protein [Gilvimarinus chinensis]|uniref:hypothetical protein n=1 Tax=Gilvimarinus chinensis TaxID=396005 RepID=UPI00036AE355|nr:hypothetical protein [Gilvimarinus chinensis]
MPKLPQHDPVKERSRKESYEKLEADGEMQEAIWEALERVAEQGIDLGQKFAAVSQKRARIKRDAKAR